MLLLDNNDSLFAGDSKDLNTTNDNRVDTMQQMNGFRNMDSDLGILSKGFMASSEAQSPSRPKKVFNDHLRKFTKDRLITRDQVRQIRREAKQFECI